MSPRTIDSETTELTARNANTARAKCSAGPNIVASAVSAGMNSTVSMVAMVPPTKAPIAAVASDLSARPLFAILCPSNVAVHTRLYFMVMKTAISLPDEVFERASRRASELGLSRSEFFARAAVSYLRQLDEESDRARIDAAVADIGGEDLSNTAAVAAGRRRLAEGSEEW